MGRVGEIGVVAGMMPLALTGLREIVVVGAHCDDIAIGMGATLNAMCTSNPGLVVHAFVATGAGTAREAEERAALVGLCDGAELSITVGDHADGRLPHTWNSVKSEIGELAARTSPDIVFGPQTGDRHQDHRLVAEILPTAFRNHLILGYEILKWEADTPSANVFVPVKPDVLAKKWELLDVSYPSQHGRSWFRKDVFYALAIVRGVHCQSEYAEAFVAEKIVIGIGN